MNPKFKTGDRIWLIPTKGMKPIRVTILTVLIDKGETETLYNVRVTGHKEEGIFPESRLSDTPKIVE